MADADLVPFRIVGNSLNVVPKSIKQATDYLKTTIEERLTQDSKQHGNNLDEKPVR